MNRKELIEVALGLLLLCLGIIGAGVWYLYSQPNQNQLINGNQKTFMDTFTSGRAAFEKGTNAEAIAEFNQAVESAPSKSQEALAKVNLGVAYLNTDQAAGIKILKEVSLNEDYPPFYRAGAADYLLDVFLGGKNVTLAFDTIFTGPTWGVFGEGVPRTLEGGELAARKAYEWALTLYDTFPANYRVAWWYAKQIRKGGLSTATSNEYAAKIEDFIAKGDSAATKAKLDPTLPKSQIGRGYLLRGLGLEGLYTLKKVLSEEVIATYQNGLNVLSKSDTGPSHLYEREVRFSLASFLARTNAKTYRAEISSTLQPLYIASNDQYFISLHTRAKNDSIIQQSIVAIARADQTFREYLLAHGWQASEL